VRAIIITRDRVTYARRCLAALQEARLDVVVVDHGSTWGPMLDWLDENRELVVRRGDHGPHDLWQGDLLTRLVGHGRFLVTDPDVVPAADCPADWPARLAAGLEAHPQAVKAGLSLRLDNLPEHRTGQRQFIDTYERSAWELPLGGGWFAAPVDTTLAMYRSAERFDYGPAVRSAAPYQAEHLPWYVDPAEYTNEDRYYRARALAGVTHY